jgi:hypothetical protein
VGGLVGFTGIRELKQLRESVMFTGMREFAMWGVGRVYRDEGVVGTVGGG